MRDGQKEASVARLSPVGRTTRALYCLHRHSFRPPSIWWIILERMHPTKRPQSNAVDHQCSWVTNLKESLAFQFCKKKKVSRTARLSAGCSGSPVFLILRDAHVCTPETNKKKRDFLAQRRRAWYTLPRDRRDMHFFKKSRLFSVLETFDIIHSFDSLRTIHS